MENLEFDSNFGVLGWASFAFYRALLDFAVAGSERLSIHPRKFGCNWSPDGQRACGFKLRREIVKREGLFLDCLMLTLTVDPKLFASPREAYDYVRTGSRVPRLNPNPFIPRLLASFGIKNWMSVMELHKNGWPHWHLILDVSSCPSCYVLPNGEKVVEPVLKKSVRIYEKRMACFQRKISKPGVRLLNPHYLDNKELRRKWSVVYKIGTQVNLRSPKRGKTGMSYAVNYITKYMTKPNDGNDYNSPPLWIKECCCVRRFSHSKSVGRLLMKSGGVKKEVAVVEVKKDYEQLYNEAKSELRETLGADFDSREYWRKGSAVLEREEMRFEALLDSRARALASFRQRASFWDKQKNIARKASRSRLPIGVRMCLSGCAVKVFRNGVFEKVLCFDLPTLERIWSNDIQLEKVDCLGGSYSRKYVLAGSLAGRVLDGWLFPHSAEVLEKLVEAQKLAVAKNMLVRAEKFGCVGLVSSWIDSNSSRLLSVLGA